MKSTTCSGVQAPGGFSVRPRAVMPVKVEPGTRRCAVSRQPATVRSARAGRLLVDHRLGRAWAPSRPTCPSSDQTKFELIVNMKTVKAIGLTLSPAFLDRVDGDRIAGLAGSG